MGLKPELHPIRVAARRTGLKPDLIRAWERRYRAIAPGRSDTNQRLYSDADIDRLVLLKRAVEGGRTIGAVAALETAALRTLVADDVASPDDPVDRFVTAVLAAAASHDPAAIHRALSEAETDLDAVTLAGRLVPELIDRSAGAEVPVSARRMIHALIRSRVMETVARSWQRDEDRPRAVVAGLGTAAVPAAPDALAAAAAVAGWKVVCLGQVAAPADAEEMADLSGAALLGLAIGPDLGPTAPPADGPWRTLTAAATLGASWPHGDIVPVGGAYDRLLRALRACRRRSRDWRHPHLAATGHSPAGPGLLVTRPRAADLPAPSAGGVVRLASPREARELSAHLRRLPSAVTATAGELLAAALLHEFGHRLIDRTRRLSDRPVMADALEWLEDRFDSQRLEAALGAVGHATGLGPAHDEDQTLRPELLEEAVIVSWLNRNPALTPYLPLVDDHDLEAGAGYRAVVDSLASFFAGGVALGPERSSPWELLAAPVRSAPHDLMAQLEAVLRLEGELAGGFADDLVLALDILREERRPPLPVGPPAPPPPPPPLPGPAPPGEARYSPEQPWMPGLVLAARHTLVWLDQLGRRYGRPIERLDEIPDEPLAELAEQGVTGLWLVGTWRRSPASARIKQLQGQKDVTGSAYAIRGYEVAERLGGDEAFARLAERARELGLRLGADLVANHTAIDAPWVVDHPDRYIWAPSPPFPDYSFTGEDLSPDPEVAIHLADQFLDGSDAPVVFRRTDRTTGDVRYLYHGNDGTGLPWNDTAQLDLLEPDTRTALTDLIVDVARRVPVLRLDAAMTLARRHVQRLWYPRPGQGGAIPSRAGCGLSQADFDRRMPTEFWREVVDRVTAEAPETMLVAEAFWMMEATFVRELGMHRVYNSAFMHHLRDEENGRLRAVLRWAAEHDPQILARHLNFLTTPDEASAAEQFGTGAKYRGAALLLSAMPGTPLIGHGQAEGWREKYGMEFERARLTEPTDDEVTTFHRGDLARLLRRRSELAGVGDFRLLDAVTDSQRVCDDVIAFANRPRGRDLVVACNNSPRRWEGHLRAAARHPSDTGAPSPETLGQWLTPDRAEELALQDAVSGRIIRRCRRTVGERGLELELAPYQTILLERSQA